MIEKIELYLFIMCVVFNLTFIGKLILSLMDEDPKPLKITIGNKILLYTTISYIITSIILYFNV